MRRLCWLMIIGLAGMAGCEKKVQREELGHILTREVDMPGVNQPYRPQQSRPPSKPD